MPSEQSTSKQESGDSYRRHASSHHAHSDATASNLGSVFSRWSPRFRSQYGGGNRRSSLLGSRNRDCRHPSWSRVGLRRPRRAAAAIHSGGRQSARTSSDPALRALVTASAAHCCPVSRSIAWHCLAMKLLSLRYRGSHARLRTGEWLINTAPAATSGIDPLDDTGPTRRRNAPGPTSHQRPRLGVPFRADLLIRRTVSRRAGLHRLAQVVPQGRHGSR